MLFLVIFEDDKSDNQGGVYNNFPILDVTVRIVLAYYKSVKETRRKK